MQVQSYHKLQNLQELGFETKYVMLLCTGILVNEEETFENMTSGL